jgi:hypothetical protein
MAEITLSFPERFFDKATNTLFIKGTVVEVDNATRNRLVRLGHFKDYTRDADDDGFVALPEDDAGVAALPVDTKALQADLDKMDDDPNVKSDGSKPGMTQSDRDKAAQLAAERAGTRPKVTGTVKLKGPAEAAGVEV